MAQAELVAGAVAAVLDRVHEVVLLEQREASEYSRLVDRADLVLQLHEAQRTALGKERLRHNQPVGRGFHPVPLKQFRQVYVRHISYLFLYYASQIYLIF